MFGGTAIARALLASVTARRPLNRSTPGAATFLTLSQALLEQDR